MGKRNIHQAILNNLESRLQVKHPGAKFYRNEEWHRHGYDGEVDLKMYLPNGWMHWYEVKSHDNRPAYQKAKEQSERYYFHHRNKPQVKYIYVADFTLLTRRLHPEYKDTTRRRYVTR